MKVSVILKNKPQHEVATIGPDQSVGEAASTLSTRGIGALVVSRGQGAIDGILSERDIVRQLGARGLEVLTQPVREIMTEKVETCRVNETALEVLGRMSHGRFRHLPVVDDSRRMIGILSIGDVVKARLEEIEAENAAMADMLSG